MGRLAGQLQQGGVGQAHPDVFGGVLNRDRQLHPFHDPREELRVVGLRQPALGRGLQDQPGCPGRAGMGSQGGLLLHAGAGHCDGHRDAPGHVLGDPIDQGPTLGLAQLVDLGAQAEHGNAMGTPADAALNLPAHGGPVQPPAAGEECVLHGIDAGERDWLVMLCLGMAS